MVTRSFPQNRFQDTVVDTEHLGCSATDNNLNVH